MPPARLLHPAGDGLFGATTASWEGDAVEATRRERQVRKERQRSQSELETRMEHGEPGEGVGEPAPLGPL